MSPQKTRKSQSQSGKSNVKDKGDAFLDRSRKKRSMKGSSRKYTTVIDEQEQGQLMDMMLKMARREHNPLATARSVAHAQYVEGGVSAIWSAATTYVEKPPEPTLDELLEEWDEDDIQPAPAPLAVSAVPVPRMNRFAIPPRANMGRRATFADQNAPGPMSPPSRPLTSRATVRRGTYTMGMGIGATPDDLSESAVSARRPSTASGATSFRRVSALPGVMEMQRPRSSSISPREFSFAVREGDGTDTSPGSPGGAHDRPLSASRWTQRVDAGGVLAGGGSPGRKVSIRPATANTSTHAAQQQHSPFASRHVPLDAGLLPLSYEGGGATSRYVDFSELANGKPLPRVISEWQEWAVEEECELRDTRNRRRPQSAFAAGGGSPSSLASRVLPQMNTNGHEYEWLSPRGEAPPPAPLPTPPPEAPAESPRYRRPVLAPSENLTLMAREERRRPPTAKRYTCDLGGSASGGASLAAERLDCVTSLVLGSSRL